MNHFSKEKWVSSYFALYLKKQPDEIKDVISKDRIDSIALTLLSGGHRFIERVSRRTFDPVLSRIPGRARLRITDMFKKFRNPRKEISLKLPGECCINRVIIDLRDTLGADVFRWNDNGAVVCLTHDIDNKIGYNFIPHILEYYTKYGGSATFNFLTNYDYEISDSIISEIESVDCEIGLHGFRHDIGLAYCSKKYMRRRLTKALERLPMAIHGYRSPALSNSESLFEVLVELGIRYDSTLQVTNTFYKSVETCFPYQYKDFGLWEIPLTLQDDVFFRDAKLSEKKALQLTIDIIQQVRDIGGVCVLNLHPHLIKDREYFFEGLLEFLSLEDDLWICPLRDVYDFLQKEEN